MAGGKDAITKTSNLLFKWRLELPGGQTKTVERQIRADHAFDRGVPVPSEWVEQRSPPSVVPASFTAEAARELAKQETQKAKSDLGDACASVLCRCPGLPPALARRFI